ncbi:MAG: leucyl aminopeptidase [Pseudomonadota bacterium]
MSKSLTIAFSAAKLPTSGTLFVLAAEDLACASAAEDLMNDAQVQRAVEAMDFSGKTGSSLDIIAPSASGVDRLVILGIGDVSAMTTQSWIKLGGTIASKLGGTKAATVLAEVDADAADATGDNNTANIAANIAYGAKLRTYSFDKYKTKKKDNGKTPKAENTRLTLATSENTAAKKAWNSLSGIADGVHLARDLVNEPANVLGPVEFAAAAKELEQLGCKVSILGDKELSKIGMGSLLSVSQGSTKPARVAIIEWKGGKAKDKPVAFVGKGVVFDTGGISIKPGAGMGDMKGDMGGAATVTGLLHALAARKAKVNAVGVIGCVENMPDGDATRPGDIVKSLSGQTIEILNTDAEGRLVLADLLWYVEDKFKPQFMVDLATLTGAILVALGSEHAGLFSNNDELSEQLSAAGQATGELVWRMPLSKAYDKLIDTPNADMKNIGGRMAGSITAAQFLQRFVRDTPWAHLDVAGTAMNAPKSEISQSWASGYGVRLLDRLVADNYEG